jgi:vitamin B12 transporter
MKTTQAPVRAGSRWLIGAALGVAGIAGLQDAHGQPGSQAAMLASADTPIVAPLVVTASRIEQDIADAIPHTTILTERDIRESQAVDVLSLLRREAGFEFVQSGGVGSISGVFLRGAENRQTLLLIDGQRVESATAGFPALDQIMLADIERIEVVRGNVSSLYGSGAVGGVIQVFTKGGSGPLRGEAQFGGGSRDTWRLSAALRGEVDATRFALSASALRTDGFSALDPEQLPFINPDKDGYRNLSASGSVEHRVNAVIDVGARLFRSSGDVKYDNPFAAAPTDIHSSDNTVTSMSAFARFRPSDAWKATLTLGEGRDRNENFTNGLPDGLFETRNGQLSLVNEISLAPDHVVTAGYEHLRQRVESSTEYTGTRRDVDSVWLGYVGRRGAHQFQLNGRFDHYSDFGDADSWLAGYGYEITPELKVTAMLSTAFTAPTFNFLYFPDFGNPELQPERAKSAELGVQYAQPGRLARLVWFHTEYSDLIQGVPPTFLPQNVAEATVDGIEASFNGSLLGVDWRMALTWQDPVNDQTGAQLLRRSRRHATLAAARSFGDVRVGGELIASGPRPDISASDFSPTTLAGYAIVNLTARWQIDKSWWLGLRVENAFDRDYTLVSGYQTAGRGAFVTVGWQP